MMQTKPVAKRKVAAIGEEIGAELGAQFIQAYQAAHPTDTTCYVVGKEIIEQILAQPGCEGIRFYNAYDETGKKTLVYVGVDEAGKSLIEYTVINGQGDITTKKAMVADRAGDDGDSFWKWLFNW